MEGHWWKCQILGKDAARVFRKGEVVFARKRDKLIVLFDGNRKRGDIPRRAIRDLKILSRLGKHESEVVDTSYSLARSLESRDI